MSRAGSPPTVDLAPGGVFPASLLAEGPVSSYLAFSPLPFAGRFARHTSVGHPPVVWRMFSVALSSVSHSPMHSNCFRLPRFRAAPCPWSSDFPIAGLPAIGAPNAAFKELNGSGGGHFFQIDNPGARFAGHELLAATHFVNEILRNFHMASGALLGAQRNDRRTPPALPKTLILLK